MAGGLRWTAEEDQLFVQGLKVYGDGKWTKIAEMIGSRTALQVKNRARHVIEYESDSELSKTLREMRSHRGDPIKARRTRHEVQIDRMLCEGVSEEEDSVPATSPKRASVEESPRRKSRRITEKEHSSPLPRKPKVFQQQHDDEEYIQVEDETAFEGEIDVDDVDEEEEEDSFVSPYASESIEASTKRKRKVLTDSGDWVHEHELDGRTIVHEHPTPPVRRSGRKQGKRPLTEDSWDHNPFRLVPPQNYGDQAPFEVIMAPQVLLTMDFHAHLSVAEVIGLLGGKFDPLERKLMVLSIYPCKSIGTRKECEMDPISEMEAVSQFSEMGLTPVGWYHSHPTFEPSPSCRDIETQTMYQSLFCRAQDNAEPFLGYIISPFLKSRPGESIIECIHLANCKAQDEQFRLPCRVDYQIEDTGEFFEFPDDLVDLYVNLQNIYTKSANFAGHFYENYFINKLSSRFLNSSYEPSARALIQRFFNKLKTP